MRVNVYAEEMTDRIEIISKEIEGETFTGLRIYLHLPVTRVYPNLTLDEVQKIAVAGDEIHRAPCGGFAIQSRGPFVHRPGDDDSGAVTFWGKRDLRDVLRKALAALDAHYETMPWETAPSGQSVDHSAASDDGLPEGTKFID